MIVADLVKETTTSTGTGNITLAGAMATFRTFNAGVGVGPSFPYRIDGGTEWEVGVGHLSNSTTLVRDSVQVSTNSNALVSFSAGTKTVYITASADLLNRIAPTQLKIRYVSTTGNDSTAVLGDITRPWASVRTAVDACSVGDTVCLLPGTHTPAPPLVLKNGVTLTSLLGRGATNITFSGDFVMSAASGSGPTVHGGQIQPSAGVSGVDACYVSGLSILLNANLICNLANITGVNTATGGANTGTGAEYIDMIVNDCDLYGASDVHVIIDAKQRTYFRNCTLVTSYDFCHLIGPNNIAHLTLQNCEVLYRPWGDSATLRGYTVDTLGRIRSGSLTLSNVKIKVYNDGTTDWSSGGMDLVDSQPAGIVVDHASGAKLIVDNVTWETLAAFPVPIRRYGSNAAAGTPSLGSVVVTGGAVDLCEYNSASLHPSPPRIVPRNPAVLKASIFAAAAASTTKNNTYRCTAAATSQAFTLFTLPPGVAVKAVWIDCTTAFSGGAASAVTAEFGIVGNTAKYLAATDVKGATGITASANLMYVEGSGDVFTGTGTLVQVVLRTTGANVSTLTAGQVDVHIELSAAAGV